MRKTGQVKFYNEAKGYGFIINPDGSETFVHATGIKDGQRIKQNDQVEFDEAEGKKGINAINVEVV